MSIANSLAEMESINKEIKNLTEALKPLRKRKSELEEVILKYMNDKDQAGLKYKDMILLQEKGVAHMKKKKDEKIQSLKGVLEKAGMHPSQDLMDKIVGSLKGKSIEKTKLKVANKDNKKKKNK